MRLYIVLCISIFAFSSLSQAYLHLKGYEPETLEFLGDAGEPLFLTPLIEANKVEEAQKAAKVNLPGVENLNSYSGFLTVNEQYKSNLFFWFFESRNNPATDPVILWLQGGPGSSSLFGLFVENGPFFITNGLEVVMREYAWTNNHSVLYIDNPVGTGWSFTRNDHGFADNQTQVGKELYSALVQFFQLFPQLQKNEFYITGESYGGKYVPAIAYTIMKNNPSAKLKINLQGLAIGDGLSDPITQMTQYGSLLYEIGFIDINVRRQYELLEKKLEELIKNEDWPGALIIIDELMLSGGNSLFERTTKYSNVYNYLIPQDPTGNLTRSYYRYINQEEIRRALHVGNLSYGGSESGIHLELDIPKSVKPWIIELLSNYRVLVYSGQVDLIVGYALTSNYLQHLEYSSAKEFQTAKRFPYYAGSDLAGYSKTAGNLTDLMIRNSGHLVPYDQPVWALDMITRFTRNQPFH